MIMIYQWTEINAFVSFQLSEWSDQHNFTDYGHNDNDPIHLIRTLKLIYVFIS